MDKIKKNMSSSIVINLFKDWHSKLNQRSESHDLWYDLFAFWLDYISINIDCLWENKESQESLLDMINENPLIIEAIVEKSMKFWIQQGYQPHHKMIQANIDLLRRLRKIEVFSNFKCYI